MVDDFGAGLVQAGVAAVDVRGRPVVLRSGDTMRYDTLVLAPGARMLPAFDDAVTFSGPGGAAAMRTLLDELEQVACGGSPSSRRPVAGWTLPLYELALLTARHADRGAASASSPSSRRSRVPLALFGERRAPPSPSCSPRRGIEFIGGESHVELREGAVRLIPGGRTLAVERLVALPLVRGPGLEGVPAEPDFGFIPVDRHGRVDGLDGVYAAGDATNFPVKQGGLAAQQADAVAEHVAARHGARLGAVAVPPGAARAAVRGRRRSATCARRHGERGRAAAVVAADQDRGALPRALPVRAGAGGRAGTGAGGVRRPRGAARPTDAAPVGG